MELELDKIYNCDCLEGLKKLEDKSVKFAEERLIKEIDEPVEGLW